MSLATFALPSAHVNGARPIKKTRNIQDFKSINELIERIQRERNRFDSHTSKRSKRNFLFALTSRGTFDNVKNDYDDFIPDNVIIELLSNKNEFNACKDCRYDWQRNESRFRVQVKSNQNQTEYDHQKESTTTNNSSFLPQMIGILDKDLVNIRDTKRLIPEEETSVSKSSKKTSCPIKTKSEVDIINQGAMINDESCAPSLRSNNLVIFMTDSLNFHSTEPKNKSKPQIRKSNAILLPRRNRNIRLPSTLHPYTVPLMLPLTTKEKEYLFQKRDERIQMTKAKRENLEIEHQRKLIENIARKEQKRIHLAAMKQIRMRKANFVVMIKLASTTHKWLKNVPLVIEKYRFERAYDIAALKIQKMWKKEMFVRRAMEARMVNKKLVKIGWRLKIWCRSTRRKLHSQLLRRFFHDFSIQQLNYIIYTFRYRVMKAQRLIRSFIECKRARVQLLGKMWVDLERQIATSEDITRKRRRKNALVPLKVLTKFNKFSKFQGHSKPFGGLAAEVFNMPLVPTRRNIENSNNDLVRIFCRFHLEDMRREHIQKSAGMMKEVANKPDINQNHARMLLSGEDVVLGLESKRRWPSFVLYHYGKQKMRRAIEGIHKDENTFKERIKERVSSDDLMSKANRYGGGLEEEFVNMDKQTFQKKNCKEDCSLAHKYKTTPNKIQELREIFQLVDLDGGGTISADEFGKLFDLLGMHKDDDEIQDIMNEIDKTCSGEVDFTQFVGTLQGNRPTPPYSESMVLCAFQGFAKDKMPPGKIQYDQLFDALISYSGKWTQTQARLAMRNAGLTTSPVIHYKDFVQVMFQLCQS